MKKVYSVVIGEIFNGSQYSLIINTRFINDEGVTVDEQNVNIICGSMQEAINRLSEITNN